MMKTRRMLEKNIIGYRPLRCGSALTTTGAPAAVSLAIGMVDNMVRSNLGFDSNLHVGGRLIQQVLSCDRHHVTSIVASASRSCIRFSIIARAPPYGLVTTTL